MLVASLEGEQWVYAVVSGEERVGVVHGAYSDAPQLLSVRRSDGVGDDVVSFPWFDYAVVQGDRLVVYDVPAPGECYAEARLAVYDVDGNELGMLRALLGTDASAGRRYWDVALSGSELYVANTRSTECTDPPPGGGRVEGWIQVGDIASGSTEVRQIGEGWVPFAVYGQPAIAAFPGGLLSAFEGVVRWVRDSGEEECRGLCIARHDADGTFIDGVRIDRYGDIVLAAAATRSAIVLDNGGPSPDVWWATLLELDGAGALVARDLGSWDWRNHGPDLVTPEALVGAPWGYLVGGALEPGPAGEYDAGFALLDERGRVVAEIPVDSLPVGEELRDRGISAKIATGGNCVDVVWGEQVSSGGTASTEIRLQSWCCVETTE